MTEKQISIVMQMGHDVGGNFNIIFGRASAIVSLHIGKQIILCEYNGAVKNTYGTT